MFRLCILNWTVKSAWNSRIIHSVLCYASNQRVHCSLGLRAKRTNEFSNRSCVFIQPTCLTLSLNKKFEATLTHDIHWIGVFTNQGVCHRKHRHQPFQKLAQIVVVLKLKISLEYDGCVSEHYNSLLIPLPFFTKTATWNGQVLRIWENANYDGQFLKFLYFLHNFLNFDAVLYVQFGISVIVRDKLNEPKLLRDL